ncbi:MAG: inorganic phosphate transporter [Methanoregula sp.]|jgi:PiT family inorganic phosphate transporter|uniref:inorganic phosphate transporter n=1 Tax=Methanoregula sp. TaxID=2052170 RepID=UPI0025F0952F|nr:inorganic phosphate transporter [Methanoregula sp.]MCK9632515.1 inorganic phosphate transporter [Methanoregula sp.]
MIEIAISTILLALAFTFTNGFQDASSIAATFISSRSASPKAGILIVAVMSFFGAILGGSAVVFTLTGLVSLPSSGQEIIVLFAALVAATAWNIVTWKYSMPSSSTHSLIGGLVGAGIVAAGTGSVFWGVSELLGPAHELAGFTKIIFFFVISVMIGFAGSFLMHRISALVLRNTRRTANRTIMGLNWCVAAVMAFANGANDSQKQMGMIVMVLVASGLAMTAEVPLWARGACAVLLALGTISGGWRIMNTLGRRIFRIEPVHSFDSQFFSASSIALSTIAGAPVSSTQVITMSVLGVGAAENPKKVKWEVGRHIVTSMVITIPVTMLISGILYLIIWTVTGG